MSKSVMLLWFVVFDVLELHSFLEDIQRRCLDVLVNWAIIMVYIFLGWGSAEETNSVKFPLGLPTVPMCVGIGSPSSTRTFAGADIFSICRSRLMLQIPVIRVQHAKCNKTGARGTEKGRGRLQSSRKGSPLSLFVCKCSSYNLEKVDIWSPELWLCIVICKLQRMKERCWRDSA